MPAMRYLVLERRFRRTDLSTLQGVERLAKRGARRFGRVAQTLICIGARAIYPKGSLRRLRTRLGQSMVAAISVIQRPRHLARASSRFSRTSDLE